MSPNAGTIGKTAPMGVLRVLALWFGLSIPASVGLGLWLNGLSVRSVDDAVPCRPDA
jgi:hypothetical protein